MIRALVLCLLLMSCGPQTAEDVTQHTHVPSVTTTPNWALGPEFQRANYIARLRTLIGPGHTMGETQLYVTAVFEQPSRLESAWLSDTSRPLRQISVTPGYCNWSEIFSRPGCAVAEDIALPLSEGDLRVALELGLNVQLWGPLGQVEVELPHWYVEGYADALAP